MWVNNKQPVTTNLWSSGEPDGRTSQNCAGAKGTGLVDLDCDRIFGFIREFYWGWQIQLPIIVKQTGPLWTGPLPKPGPPQYQDALKKKTV